MNFRENNFDLIRLIAAFQVMVLHGLEHLNLLKGSLLKDLFGMFPGVPIFFVVSGFLISASYERNKSISGYILNRVLRIYPALWGCFIFSILLVLSVYDIDFSSMNFWVWSIAQISVGQFYNPDFMRGYGVGVLNGSLWTIPVELQFYMVLPLLYVVLRYLKWSRFFLVFIFSLLVLFNQIYYEFIKGGDSILIKLIGVTLIPYFYMFLIGVLLHRYKEFLGQFVIGKTLSWLILYIVVVFLGSQLGWKNHGNEINPIQTIVLGFLVVSFALTKYDAISGVCRGYDLSYGIYIYHMVFLNLFVHLNLFGPVLSFTFQCVCTFIMAYFSWVFIEKPALKMKSNSSRRMVL